MIVTVKYFLVDKRISKVSLVICGHPVCLWSYVDNQGVFDHMRLAMGVFGHMRPVRASFVS